MYKIYEKISNQTKGKFLKHEKLIDELEVFDDEGNNLFLNKFGIEDNDLNNKSLLTFLIKNVKDIQTKGSELIYDLQELVANYLSRNNLSNLDKNFANMTLSNLKSNYSSASKSEFKATAFHKGTKIVANNNSYILYEVSSVEDACEIGKGTGWCTKDPKFAKQYMIDDYPGSKLYVLTKADGDKLAQIHFESGQIKDIKDRPTKKYNKILKSLWKGFNEKFYKQMMRDAYEKEDYQIFIDNLGEFYEGDVNLYGTPITDLGNLTTVRGGLNLYGTPITDLGNLTTVGKSLDLRGTSITDLGNLTTVGGIIFGFRGDKSKYPQFQFA
jgi:hypothetical protein